MEPTTQQRVPAFIREHHKWTGLAALIISLIAIALSCINECSNRGRWEALNEPRLSFKSVRLAAFAEVPIGKILEYKWGYEPIIHSAWNNGLRSDKLLILSTVLLWDPVKSKHLSGHLPSLTVPEAEAEARRLQIKSYELRKLIQPYFVFTNSGNTTARNVVMHLRLLSDIATSKDSQEVSNSELRDIAPGEELTLSLQLKLPLEVPLPDPFIIEVEIGFESILHPYHSVRRFIYNQYSNGWAEKIK